MQRTTHTTHRLQRAYIQQTCSDWRIKCVQYGSWLTTHAAFIRMQTCTQNSVQCVACWTQHCDVTHECSSSSVHPGATQGVPKACQGPGAHQPVASRSDVRIVRNPVPLHARKIRGCLAAGLSVHTRPPKATWHSSTEGTTPHRSMPLAQHRTHPYTPRGTPAQPHRGAAEKDGQG
jgi:hypothetical protein